MIMSVDKLSEMQIRLLDMFKYFHTFCEENGITYYSGGGTVLGAIRHNGFIPWDDDIDVALPREDYDRLIKCFKSGDGRYVIESTYSEDPKYCFPYAKIYDTRTTLIENTKNPIKRGIFIDIFPLDGMGSTREESLKLFKNISRRKKLLDLRTIKITGTRAWYKNAILFFVQIVPSCFINNKKLALKIEDLCKKKSIEESKFMGTYVGAWNTREIIPKEAFGSPVLHEFEDTFVYVPEDSVSYLEHLYGDWQTPPPEEKRVSHHDFYLDLGKSYLEE